LNAVSPVRLVDAMKRVKVIVVLPIYRDTSLTMQCINSALQGLFAASQSQLILINDASPEPDMRSRLDEIALQWPDKIQLLHNDKNLGFVKTANIGLKLAGDRDVVLLNNDVILPKVWLERLVLDAYSSGKVGTVTPLSNNTTISSFPNFFYDNSPPLGLDLDTINQSFGESLAPLIDAPTGVGFCMYVKNACLHDVGLLNENAFGLGYGEENDFCQRAVTKGWTNVISPNLYVYHKGGVSFAGQRDERQIAAQETLQRLHPRYASDIQKFCADDPLKAARIQRYCELIGNSGLPVVLHVSHGLGGGIAQHIEELAEATQHQLISLVVAPEEGGSSVRLTLPRTDTTMQIVIDTVAGLPSFTVLMRSLGVGLVHVHHLMNVPNDLLWIGRALNVPTIFTVHDFHLVNGNPTLSSHDGRFYPDSFEDSINPLYPLAFGLSPAEWRNEKKYFLASCKLVLSPSVATNTLFHKFFPHPNAIAVNHFDRWETRDPHMTFKPSAMLRVGVLGALGKEKGADLLEAMAISALKQKLNIEFVLLGYAYRRLRGLQSSGPYQSDELGQLIEQYKCSVLFFPAQWPETYSYTLSVALWSRLPIFAPNVGAFPERLSNRPMAKLFHHLGTSEKVLVELCAFVSEISSGRPNPIVANSPQALGANFYLQEYASLADVPIQIPSHTVNFAPVLADLARFQKLPRFSRKEKFLRFAWRLYAHPAFARTFALIPYSVKRAVKRKLSSKPIHELMRDR
jgi:GT2 family glycosyltransferase/glycosyltransferase involved in cell wall biosynthesis